ncbi:GGDEF domain-containing protein [Motiliproteus sp. MSK22-1]|uniref:GGDEF domain-containing protein n=1 Tax=Motiliproteus sp. MSK22-1 TaxID=1897630 RepID=UPI000976D650|nr:GGDEF domain-containing protein [Motiliproteus sp. MSK22-1]OMH39805.1 hypothetical protein BGP75_01765 [Motiliproteus sp. MSK22-1]
MISSHLDTEVLFKRLSQSILHLFAPWLALYKKLHLDSLISSRYHARDFSEIRAQYIDSRVRLLAGMFTFLTPMWIPIDYLILEDDHFLPMVCARILFALLLMFLWILPSDRCSMLQARVRLILLMILPSLFHISTQWILGSVSDSELLICYTFLPLLIIAMHSIFPLTLSEGIGLASFTIVLLSLDELSNNTLFTIRGLGHLWLLCLIMGVAIWAQLSQLHIELKMHHQSITDPLTGLLNRRTLMKLLEHEKKRHQRHGRSSSLMMLDMDYFKQINDCYGHGMGDRVLQRFSQIIREQTRGSDILARYGGEEFIVILPETSAEDATILAERIHDANHRLPLPTVSGEPLFFTVSIGITEFNDNDSLESTLSKTDEALYQAKEAGRNCTIVRS